MTSTAPERAPGGVLDTSWPEWTGWAVALDQLDLATELFAACPPALETRETTVDRAQALLRRGLPGEARSALASVGVTTTPAGEPETWADAVLVAVQAAEGHAPSMQMLLRLRASATGGAATTLSHLVAAAAHHAGSRDLADEAWRDLAVERGVVTPTTVRGLVVGQVARRDPADADAALATIGTQLKNLCHLDPGPTQDPGPALDAAAELEGRGDVAGARLLLEALCRTHRPHPAVTHARDALTPRDATRRHTALVVVVGAVALPILLPLGPLAYLIVAGLGRLWRSHVPLPGLGRTDSQVLRALRTLHFDARSGAVTQAGAGSAGWYGVGAVLGFVVGMVLAIQVSTAADAALGPSGVRDAVTWLSALVGLPTVGYLIAHRVLGRVQAARGHRDGETLDRRTIASAGTCRCWSTPALTGRLASAYASRHLQPVLDPTVAAELERRLGPRAQAATCPTSGALWLAGPLGRAGTPLALRGLVPVPTTALPDPSPSVGFYL